MSNKNYTWDVHYPACPERDFSCYYCNTTGRCEMFDKENCFPYDMCNLLNKHKDDEEYNREYNREEEIKMVRDIYNIPEWTSQELNSLKEKIDRELFNREKILRDRVYKAITDYEEFLGEDKVIASVSDDDFNEIDVYLSSVKDWFISEINL